ncbi:helix-turn-helix domain-containing protein [Flavobacterium rakeshii]|uniref:helix-turn-helix domain-containing protein n=1 Tax=Flavobacterium rakeshii TaxID=1038845 RepID=UPI002E7B7807|nr:helix-turn-helix domain-containing protein [Flavobacterium rakeshii]MEE1897972.1 helix-turn-helix domain-containing protein [Flavobacterium rakeshii]
MTKSLLINSINVDELQAVLREVVQQEIGLLENKIKKEDILLTREEACKLLSVDQSTLWSWTKKGKITAYGIGHRRYYKRSELLEALSSIKFK